MTFNQDALSVFLEAKEDTNRWESINAKQWASYFWPDASALDIINGHFTRDDLLNADLTDQWSDELYCMAILAWGGKNRDHAKLLFDKKHHWLPIVQNIRKGKITTRQEAYAELKRLQSKGQLPGTGPAFYTKWICFLNPYLNGYIMDQWTAKSVNILSGEIQIKLSANGAVLNSNRPEQYEWYCRIIEALADRIKRSPLDTEEALFSYGGYQKGIWRTYVLQVWNKERAKKSDLPNQKYHIMEELHPIEFFIVINLLKDKTLSIKTLGLKSFFEVTAVGNQIQITTSGNHKGKIDKAHWDKVMNRMEELPMEERVKPSRYNHGNAPYHWKDAPSQRYSPYLPAIVRYIQNLQNSNV